ncbi:hypothetical protein QBC37DRAFT_381369 [Rhypophila decipiens]|uniref:Uncharacterized protein n=1 Tax=Rhypophila decipiens TaxID=261697 RepID=A0AAN6XSM4_9PEZI|nr:hypothetical protein QBC37DRAFT_381369 [Rhypophila decipiens]
MITVKIKEALDLLEKLEKSLLLFIHGRVRDLRDDILRNFDLTNSNCLAGSSTWPAYAVRKLTFMNEVEIGVYGDFMNLVPLFKSMHEVWREEVSKDDIFTWSESVQRHISFWGDHFQASISMKHAPERTYPAAYTKAGDSRNQVLYLGLANDEEA